MKSILQLKDNEIIFDINQQVKQLCLSPNNKLLPTFYDLHLCLVENYALQLANILNADKEVVQISALLHDISVVSDFSTLPNHAFESAVLAKQMLNNYELSDEMIAQIIHCIETHTSPIQIGIDTPEAVCISNADAMAQIAAPSYWLYFAFSIMKMNYYDGLMWYKKRVYNNWNSIIRPASDIVYDSYLKTILLFEKTSRNKCMNCECSL